MSSEILRNSHLKKLGQSDVDPKELKELLDHLQSPNCNQITSIKSFDCSTTQPFLTRILKPDSETSATRMISPVARTRPGNRVKALGGT